MKNAIIILVLLMFVSMAEAKVMVTEVYYDPLQTETGGEAVELFNEGEQAVDISGWSLRTKSSAKDATIPDGTSLNPLQYYLITDAGWNLSKDSPEWPEADHEEALTLTNADGGLALVNKDGTIMDAVGWGSPDQIPPELFEGTPHAGVAQGISLQRKTNGTFIDSEDNSADFIEGAPTLLSGIIKKSAQTIDVIINITNSPIKISSAELTGDDLNVSGIQLLPFPGKMRTAKLSLKIDDADGLNDISSVQANFLSQIINSTSETAEINGSLFMNFSVEIPYYQIPGNYSASITAEDVFGAKDNITIPFEILEIAGISLEKTELILKGINGSAAASIRNIGNGPLAIELSSTNFSSDETTIIANQMAFRITNLENGNLFLGNLTDKPQRTSFALNPAAEANLELFLNTLTNTSRGLYRGKVLVTGTK
ncbi:MAG: lamin tail domain-containing protein [Nanoarchaeota archaeon]